MAVSSIAAAALALFATSSFADTAPTGSFDVKVTVTKACAITTLKAGDVQFDPVNTTNTTGQSKQTTLSVKCSKTTPYEIGLSPGNVDATNPANTAGLGFMKRTPAGSANLADQKIAYQLNTAANAVWGNVTGASGNTLKSTGNGAIQNHVVTAVVTGSATVWNVEPGDYLDTVTVTVTY